MTIAEKGFNASHLYAKDVKIMTETAMGFLMRLKFLG
jgi:hypothetical protein